MNALPTTFQQTPLPPLSLRPPHPKSPLSFPKPPPPRPIRCCSAIDMLRGADGSYSPRPQTAVVLWDLDNKPPRGQPFAAAVSLRRLAELFGRVLHISAYANRHAFLHLPEWVIRSRRERRELDGLERKGLLLPDQPYVCGVCGRKCATNPELKRHFRTLHERERRKKVARMRSLKGKRRERFRRRFVSGDGKYEEAAREVLTPGKGYGLASELRRAGVVVRTVEDKPQAADSAVKRQMRDSMARGIDWLFLVSDDSGFSEMVRRAREADLRTVVIGDGRRALGRVAEFWVPWMGVEKGEVGEEVLLRGRNGGFRGGGEEEDEEEGLFYSPAVFDDGEEEEEEEEEDGDGEDDGEFGDLDDLVDEVVVERSGFGAVRVSAFSEEEMWDGDGVSGVDGETVPGTSLSWTSEDEDDYYI